MPRNPHTTIPAGRQAEIALTGRIPRPEWIPSVSSTGDRFLRRGQLFIYIGSK